ncbi:MAG: SpoVA/SpoVAEb family sporulation membrane protein [Eggerthellaceae bacterium]|nr:SpoVA/SpoVAEb family sporulation membrane protein [Eggerthellaceae bacterium]
MKQSKPYILAFVTGGIFCAIGQIFLLIWTALLGEESPFIICMTLLSMGVLGIVLFVTGLHQKIAEATGWGTILTFNGFGCALSAAYEDGAKKGGAKRGWIELLDVFIWVEGVGVVLAIIVGIAYFFMFQAV